MIKIIKIDLITKYSMWFLKGDVATGVTTLARMAVATKVTQVMGSTRASRSATRVTGDIWPIVEKKARD